MLVAPRRKTRVLQVGNVKIGGDNPIVVQIGTQVTKVVEQETGALGLAQVGVVRERNLPELMTERFIEVERRREAASPARPASANCRSCLAGFAGPHRGWTSAPDLPG